MQEEIIQNEDNEIEQEPQEVELDLPVTDEVPEVTDENTVDETPEEPDDNSGEIPDDEEIEEDIIVGDNYDSIPEDLVGDFPDELEDETEGEQDESPEEQSDEEEAPVLNDMSELDSLDDEQTHFVSRENLTQYTTKVKEYVQGYHDATKLDTAPDGENSFLDNNNKINTEYIPDVILGQVKYQGTWDASSSTSQVVSTPVKGDYYICEVTGTHLPTGETSSFTFEVGDWAIYNGTSWNKVDNTDAVTLVNGQKGSVETFKGTFDITRQYYKGDFVVDNDGVAYLCKVTDTNKPALTDTTTWHKFVSAPVSRVSILPDASQTSPDLVEVGSKLYFKTSYYEYSITVDVVNGTYDGGVAIREGGVAQVTITPDVGYLLPSEVVVTGASYNYNNGIVDLFNPTGDVSILATCELEENE